MPLFGADTGEPLPQDYLTSHRAWDGYMGRVWHDLLVLAGIGHKATVVEVATGTSLKMVFALSQLGFRGHLVCVDPVASNLAIVQEEARNSLPEARVTCIAKPLMQALAEIPVAPDLLCANHPFDDMLVAAGHSPLELENMFSWTQHDADFLAFSFAKAWQALKGNAPALQEAEAHVMASWTAAIGTLNPAYLLVNQYDSSVLTQSAMSDLNGAAFALMKALGALYENGLPGSEAVQEVLNRHPHHQNQYIGTQVLNAEKWLAMKRANGR